MEHMSAVEYHEHNSGGNKEIIRVTVILTVLTIVELGLGFGMMGMEEGSFMRNFIKGVILILMLAKAFYIVGYFMHLKHEIRNFIMTITVPLLLFVWFIIAFLYDGNSYNNNRNVFTPFYKVRSAQKAPAHEGQQHEGQESEGHEKKDAPKELE